MMLAPILLFTYKRLETLKRTIDALKKNELSSQSELYIFSDGPKNLRDELEVCRVRDYLKNVDGFKNVFIKESVDNLGLGKSIISGVSDIISKFDKVIVLEDDLLTTPNFLSFLNGSLTNYQNYEKVFSISGYSFDLDSENAPLNQTYFLPRGWSWGWATWKDRWEKVDWNISDYEDFRENRSERKEFAKGGSDLNKMLRDQMEGSLDSWAIRWFYNQYKVKGLTLYPCHSKVYNIGFDSFATHTKGSNRRYIPKMDRNYSNKILFPEHIEVNNKYHNLFLNKMGILSRVRSKLESVIRSLTS